MKPSVLDSDEEDLGEYQKELRERANRSIQQLSRILGECSSEADSMERLGNQDSDSTAGEDSWNQLQQSDAVNQLRSLLQKEQKGAGPSSLSKRTSLHKQRAPQQEQPGFPMAQDLVPMIHNQSEYIQHLEAEVKFCKVDGPEPPPVAVGGPKSPPLRYSQQSEHAHSLAQPDHPTWHSEMDKLKVLYQAQTETLEAQVISLRKDLASAQKECEEVKGRLRQREVRAVPGGVQRVGGLCLKCAQHEAVLAQTHTNALVQLEQMRSELRRQRERWERELCSSVTPLLSFPQVSGELRYQLTQVQVKREEAERELRDHTSKSSRQLELAQQEVGRLGCELIGCRQRLEQAQQDGGRAHAEVLELTERLGRAEHQLHLTSSSGSRRAAWGPALYYTVLCSSPCPPLRSAGARDRETPSGVEHMDVTQPLSSLSEMWVST
ncbi:hypothetical protein JZ751_008538, partial [Albula glossodonta]